MGAPYKILFMIMEIMNFLNYSYFTKITVYDQKAKNWQLD